MTVKNLSAFITPNLKLEVGTKTYVVRPPSKETGKIMMAVNLVGIAAFTDAQNRLDGSNTVEDVPPETRELAASVADKDLGELSLGDAYFEMLEDGWDGPTVDSLSLYAFYYWTLGEEVADRIMGERLGAEPSAPKDPTPSKSGSSTE